MGRGRGRGASPELLRDRIEEWRRSSGGRGRRIPEQLWVEALEVARVHGIRDAARLLVSLRQPCVTNPAGVV